MTTPIGGTGATGGAMPPAIGGSEGAMPVGGVAVDPAAGPAVIEEAAVVAAATSDPSDVALLVQLLQSECSDEAAASEKQEARAAAAMKREQIEKKLEGIAEAIAKQAEADKWGEVGEVLKWVAIAVGAAVAAVTSVFTFGATGAVAALVITLALTANTVAKEVTNKLLADGAIDQQQAEIIGACFGNLQDIVAACIDEKDMNADAKWAIMVLGAVESAAKAVLSIVFSGGSSIGKAVEAVAAVCALGAEVIAETQALIEETMEEGQRKGLLTEEQLMYLQLCLMVVQLAASVVGAASGGGGGENRNIDKATRQAIAITKGVGGAVGAGVRLGVAGADYAKASASIDALEAKAEADRAEALKAAALEMLRASIAQLQEILDELEGTREDVDAMLDLGWQRASTAFGGARM